MIYPTLGYPKPLGSGGGVPKDLKLHVGILVLVCQELILQDFISRVMTLTFIEQTALLWDSILAILFLELMKPCLLRLQKNIHPTKCVRHLDVFGELGSTKASWDQRVCFFRPHLPKIPLTAHTYNVSKHYEENH